MIPATEQHWLSESFVDPNGRLFEWRGELYRALDPVYAARWQQWAKSGVIDGLVRDGLLIESEWSGLKTDSGNAVQHHRHVTVQSRSPLPRSGQGLRRTRSDFDPGPFPPGQGQIERLWNAFQDRLVSELRLARAKTLEQAQAVLEGYIPVHNRKFAKPARAEPAWRKLSALELERALCFKQ